MIAKNHILSILLTILMIYAMASGTAQTVPVASPDQTETTVTETTTIVITDTLTTTQTQTSFIEITETVYVSDNETIPQVTETETVTRNETVYTAYPTQIVNQTFTTSFNFTIEINGTDETINAPTLGLSGFPIVVAINSLFAIILVRKRNA